MTSVLSGTALFTFVTFDFLERDRERGTEVFLERETAVFIGRNCDVLGTEKCGVGGEIRGV